MKRIVLIILIAILFISAVPVAAKTACPRLNRAQFHIAYKHKVCRVINILRSISRLESWTLFEDGSYIFQGCIFRMGCKPPIIID